MIEIPGYTLLRPLGQGGMANVYLALQQSLGREVAIKILTPTLAQEAIASERFLREARLAAKLHHSHIVPIHDVGMHDGVPYIAMQFEPGGAVSSGERLDAGAALRIIRDIATALEYAHSKGVVHRDIKPQNILRRADGSCVLSDFGIARVMESETVLTQEGTSIGTPQYMSPEQLRGDKVDGRADLYSLGVVLYQLLTGKVPYTGSDGWAVGMQHINADIPSLPPALSRLQPLLDGLMAKNADARPQTGAEVVRRINALLTDDAVAAATIPLATTPTKPRRPGSGKWLQVGVVGVVGIVVAAGLIAAWQFTRGHPASHDAANSSAAESTQAKSIAVLPFEDMSQTRDQGYFSDGMAEELVTLLTQVPGLRVAGRTSSLSFKGKNATVKEIGKALDVATVLEGGVRKVGDRMRVTVHLVNAADGFELWSQTYDRKLTDVFAVQDDIAGSVVDALKVKLLPSARPSSGKHHVPDFATYDQYLRGRQLLVRSEPGDSAKAAEALRKAVALDPQYAEAYAALAMAESFSVEQNPDATVIAQGNARAMVAAERAVALDSRLGDAYASRGYLRGTNDWDWEGALDDLSKAITLDPDVARNQLRFGFLLTTLGRLPEAAAALQRSTEQDPLFTPAWYWLGRVKAAQLDYDGARRALDRALAIEPEHKGAAEYLGVLSLLQGDAVTAREVFASQKSLVGLALAEHDLGHLVQSKQALDQVIATHAKDNPYAIATVYAWTGDRDQAFAWLDKAVSQHQGAVVLKNDPLLRGLRDDPRYAALLKRLKLPE